MSESESDYDEEQYSAAIKRLRTKDPDFYEFLKSNDKKLLDFEDDGGDAEGDEDDEDEQFSDTDDHEDQSPKLNAAEIENLKKRIQESPNVNLCKQLAGLMRTAVSRASGGGTTDNKALSGVDGDVFNEVIKVCLVYLAPALYEILKLDKGDSRSSSKLSTSKQWKKLLPAIKCYLTDLLKLLSYMSEPSSLRQILKHVVNMIPFFVQFVKLTRLLLKNMINLWSTSEESVRVTALLVIVRGIKSMPEEYHTQVLKQMYFGYVKNSKFTSATSLPLIHFMKQSLAEVYAMKSNIAYEHCFVYLRQLCIHLRNAITTKKKEAYQTVYNWQYVRCLEFWAFLISNLYENKAMKTLVYPLVQTILGAINLVPTVKYAPLRFHLSRVLIDVSKNTDVYIPVAPIIIGALDLMDFNKKSTFTKKPMDFTCALKASKAQLQESGFKDGIIGQVCTLMNEYFTIYANSIAFPELALPTIVHVKGFLKKNKVAKYGQQLKAEIDKLQQNSEYISRQRKSVSFKITDFDKIDNWERNIKQQSLPLLKRKADTSNQKAGRSSPKKRKTSE